MDSRHAGRRRDGRGRRLPGGAEQYASELLEFAGPAFQGGAVYFTSGGSEAVEIALKLARDYQVEIGNFSRSQIISRDQSQHGSTLCSTPRSGGWIELAAACGKTQEEKAPHAFILLRKFLQDDHRA